MPAFDYTGPYAYSITANTAAGHRAFLSAAVVQGCVDALREACDTHGFVIWAYCFVPDHLHLLVEGSEDSRLVSFMKRFKQLASFRYKQVTGRSLWQRSYYDRVLLRDEDAAIVAGYIWDNPVQAGLVDHREDYPFAGPREAMVPDRSEGLSLQAVAQDEAEASSLLASSAAGASRA